MTLLVIIVPIGIAEKIPLLLDLLMIVSVYNLLLVQNIPASRDSSFAEQIISFVF